MGLVKEQSHDTLAALPLLLGCKEKDHPLPQHNIHISHGNLLATYLVTYLMEHLTVILPVVAPLQCLRHFLGYKVVSNHYVHLSSEGVLLFCLAT